MARTWIAAGILGAALAASLGGARAEGLREPGSEATGSSLWRLRSTWLGPTWGARPWWTAAPAGVAWEPPRALLLVGEHPLPRWASAWWPMRGQLHASGGLVLSARAGGGLRAPDVATGAAWAGAAGLPYFGLGYADSEGALSRGGWSFTAELGLVAENPAAGARFGRVLLGNQGLEPALRDLRLSPMLQLGARYAF